MIIDWRTMKPHIGGEGEDALGRPLPQRTCRVNTLTGEILVERRDARGHIVLDETGTKIVVDKIQMVPPITVWLYT